MFKIVLLGTINYRHSYKRCHNFQEYCIWMGQETKEEECKSNSTFLALH